mmetsp:Transcript_118118/g.294533  ORF Transcript_118118/g.294533 Transcript_118118/m.294533 type:complete len:1276 (+) Transcript_118118:64-3891(+)
MESDTTEYQALQEKIRKKREEVLRCQKSLSQDEATATKEAPAAAATAAAAAAPPEAPAVSAEDLERKCAEVASVKDRLAWVQSRCASSGPTDSVQPSDMHAAADKAPLELACEATAHPPFSDGTQCEEPGGQSTSVDAPDEHARKAAELVSTPDVDRLRAVDAVDIPCESPLANVPQAKQVKAPPKRLAKLEALRARVAEVPAEWLRQYKAGNSGQLARGVVGGETAASGQCAMASTAGLPTCDSDAEVKLASAPLAEPPMAKAPPPSSSTRVSTGGGPRGKGKAPAPGPPPPKGKGKAPGPGPPPVSARKRRDTEPSEEGREGMPSARLVPLHWRPSLAPKAEHISAIDDPYLVGVSHFFLPNRADARVDRCKARLAKYERAVAQQDLDEGQSAPQSEAPTPAKSEGGRRRRHTIFSTQCPIQELPEHKLQEFFQARSAAVEINAQNTIAKGKLSFITVEKHRQMLEIFVKKEAIRRFPKVPQQAGVDSAVDELIEALKRCDYSKYTPGMLEDLHKVLKSHLENKTQHEEFVSFIELRGPAGFERLEHPHLHRLLYGLLQIPGILARLECMILEATFADHTEFYLNNLDILHSAFECVLARLAPLRRFFATCLHFGNVLNQDSRAPVAQYGFKLASLTRFPELKTPRRKDVSLLHFVILWMCPDDVSALCEPEAIEVLNKARLARSNSVFTDIVQQLERFRGVQCFVETGRYKGQEIPRCSQAGSRCSSRRSSSSSDSGALQSVKDGETTDLAVDNRFHTRMQTFTHQGRARSEYLWKFASNMYKSYKALGAFLDDLKMVYPPPSEEKEDKSDMFEVLHTLFTTIATAHRDIERLELAKDVTSRCRVIPPLSGGEAVSAPEGPPALAVSPVQPPQNSSQKPVQSSALPDVPTTWQRQATLEAPTIGESVDSVAVSCDISSDPRASLQPTEQVVTTEASTPGAWVEASGPVAPPAIDEAVRCAESLPVAPIQPARVLEDVLAPLPPEDEVLERSPGAPVQPLSARRQQFVPPIELDDDLLATTRSSSRSPTHAMQLQGDHLPLVGPPPRRPAKKISGGLRPGAALPPSMQAQLAAVPIANASPSQPSSLAMFGVPPLSLSLCSPSNAGLLISPVILRSPQTDQRATSPRTRLGRKSLTRIANRVTSEAIKVHESANLCTTPLGASSGADDETCSSPCHASSDDYGDDSMQTLGQDLSSQILNEMRRRRSRGRSSNSSMLLGSPVPVLGSPSCPPWAEVVDRYDSPRSPSTLYYPLTPVKEQGETPYRLSEGGTTP